MPLDSANSFRRSGQRDDRRRRLLLDEHAKPAARSSNCQNDESLVPPMPASHYGDAEFLQQQLRLVDLVPRRWVSLIGVLLCLTSAAVGLGFLHAWASECVALGGATYTAFLLDGPASLGSWLLSLLLLASAVAALIIYTIRRHRVDDYQGRYRVWLWAAIGWFLMATDQATNLHDAFRQALVAWTGVVLYGDGTLLWFVMVCVVALGAVGSRLLLDMRPNRFSIITLMLAAVAQVILLIDSLHLFSVLTPSQAILSRFACEAFGAMILLAAMLVHARYVVFDAEGLLPRPCEPLEQIAGAVDSEGEEAAEQETTSANQQWRSVDQPHSSPPPNHHHAAKPPVPALVASQTAAASVSVAASPSGDQKLSKGERKALKDRLLRERLERERQKR